MAKMTLYRVSHNGGWLGGDCLVWSEKGDEATIKALLTTEGIQPFRSSEPELRVSITKVKRPKDSSIIVLSDGDY